MKYAYKHAVQLVLSPQLHMCSLYRFMHVYASLYLYIYIYTNVYTRSYIYIYVYMYMCVRVYATH